VKNTAVTSIQIFTREEVLQS